MHLIKKLFRHKRKSQEKLDTNIDAETVDKVKPDQFGQFQLPLLTLGSAQSIGKQRLHNEDSLFMLNTIMVNGNAKYPMGLFIVADGMGGHQHGDVASSMAIRAVAKRIINNFYLPTLKIGNYEQNESIHEILSNSIKDAQKAVMELAPGGGTTLSAALILEDQVHIAHIGDSRIYFIYDKSKIKKVTKDHSLVNRLIEMGKINQEEASIHPQRNVLYRAIGQGPLLSADISTLQGPKQGFILLCTDGLWGVMSDEEICQTIYSSADNAEACDNLVNEANDRGGPDNISIILLKMGNNYKNFY